MRLLQCGAIASGAVQQRWQQRRLLRRGRRRPRRAAPAGARDTGRTARRSARHCPGGCGCSSGGRPGSGAVPAGISAGIDSGRKWAVGRRRVWTVARGSAAGEVGERGLQRRRRLAGRVLRAAVPPSGRWAVTAIRHTRESRWSDAGRRAC